MIDDLPNPHRRVGCADRKTIERVMRAVIAMERNTTTDRLDEGDRAITASFADPLIHSRSEMADWVVKVNSVRPGFGSTDVAARAVGIGEVDSPPQRRTDETRISRSIIPDYQKLVDRQAD